MQLSCLLFADPLHSPKTFIIIGWQAVLLLPFPYHSHINLNIIGNNMGMIWEWEHGTHATAVADYWVNAR